MKISVIVPVYKVEKYLNRCIDSILNQTYQDFELILVDDGSPDKCGKICDEYAENDSRITVIHKENGGLSDARNAGIDWAFENSDSEWLTFIDSDDWIHPRYLEGLLFAAKKYNSDIAVCNYLDSDNQSLFEKIEDFDISYINTEVFYVDYHTAATVAWGKLYKKRFFQFVRYPFGKISEDEFITYRFIFQNGNTVFIKNALYFYYNNSDGIMHSKWSLKRLEVLEAFEQQFVFFKKENHKKAFACSVNNYIWELQHCYSHLKSYDEFDCKKRYIQLIRKRLRKCLVQNGISRPIKKNEGLYEIAYPHIYKFYSFFKRIKKKVRRMRGYSK